jgi:hypothetical protein
MGSSRILSRTVDGETDMARKVVRSISTREQALTAPATTPAAAPSKWRTRIVIAASSVAIVVLCVAIRSFIGSGSANAQIPNPFRSQPATNAAGKQGQAGVQQAAAQQPAGVQQAAATQP